MCSFVSCPISFLQLTFGRVPRLKAAYSFFVRWSCIPCKPTLEAPASSVAIIEEDKDEGQARPEEDAKGLSFKREMLDDRCLKSEVFGLFDVFVIFLCLCGRPVVDSQALTSVSVKSRDSLMGFDRVEL